MNYTRVNSYKSYDAEVISHQRVFILHTQSYSSVHLNLNFKGTSRGLKMQVNSQPQSRQLDFSDLIYSHQSTIKGLTQNLIHQLCPISNSQCCTNRTTNFMYAVLVCCTFQTSRKNKLSAICQNFKSLSFLGYAVLVSCIVIYLGNISCQLSVKILYLCPSSVKFRYNLGSTPTFPPGDPMISIKLWNYEH